MDGKAARQVRRLSQRHGLPRSVIRWSKYKK